LQQARQTRHVPIHSREPGEAPFLSKGRHRLGADPEKRLIKRLISTEHKSDPLLLEPLPAHLIVFELGEESPYLYFPASIPKLRNS
jgi:hypothetical protein